MALDRLLSPEIGLIFFQTIAIFFMAFLLKKFAWKTILAFLEQEEKNAVQAVTDFQKAREAVQELEQKRSQIIGKAQKKHDEIIEEAQKTKEALLEAAHVEASKAKDIQLAEAYRIIASEKRALRQKVKEEAAHLVVAVVEKVVRLKMQQEKQQELVITRLIEETEKQTQAQQSK